MLFKTLLRFVSSYSHLSESIVKTMFHILPKSFFLIPSVYANIHNLQASKGGFKDKNRSKKRRRMNKNNHLLPMLLTSSTDCSI